MLILAKRKVTKDKYTKRRKEEKEEDEEEEEEEEKQHEQLSKVAEAQEKNSLMNRKRAKALNIHHTGGLPSAANSFPAISASRLRNMDYGFL